MGEVTSIWKATANPAVIRTTLEENTKTDVAIIGAGFTGLATAYYLSKKGVKTTILEQHRVGWGASGRNAGMVLPGFKESAQAMAKRWGIDKAKEMLDLSLDAISTVGKIVEENRIKCSFQNSGSLGAAFKPSHFELMKRDHEYMAKQFNYETTIIEKEQLKQELDSPIYHGGIVHPKSCSFHPLNYAMGLAESVEMHGTKIYEQTPVKIIQKKAGKFELITAKGNVVANHLVIGTNGYTTEITKKLMKSVIPLGSYIVATEPLPESVTKTIIPNGRMVSDTKNFLYYFRLTPDNRMLFGGRVSFTGKENEEIYKTLHQNMLEVFPQLKPYKIDFQWGGIVGFTRDFYPHIGMLEDRTHFALGYCGHGASLSTLMGRLLAANVLGEERTKTWLEQLKLPTVPFHNQRAIALNIVGQYYRLMDLIS